MNHREPTSAPQGGGWTFLCLALLLLSFLSGARASARTQLPPQPVFIEQVSEKPYLVALGAPPLRFQDPAPVADLSVRPPKPGISQTTPPESSLKSDALGDVSSAPVPPETHAEPTTKTPAAVATNENESTPPTPTRTPLPILPDEARPQARPEDFIPFFQIPASQSGDVNVIVPATRTPATPGSMPTSSATYTQSAR
jgi:hypothetical protein